MGIKEELQAGDQILDHTGNVIAIHCGNPDRIIFPEPPSSASLAEQLLDHKISPDQYTEVSVNLKNNQAAYRQHGELPKGAVIVHARSIESIVWLWELNQKVLPLFTSRP
jgi:hypothetical protein